MRILKLLIIAIICSLPISNFAQSYNDKDLNEIEYAVKQINRICPTYMWDSWKFREIIYEKDSNTICFVIQLKNWHEEKWNRTPDQMKEYMKWIIENFNEGYENTISSKNMYGDGDFMLYLSVGTLLHKMKTTGTKLYIVLMKPDYECIIQKDTPLMIEGADINNILNKK